MVIIYHDFTPVRALKSPAVPWQWPKLQPKSGCGPMGCSARIGVRLRFFDVTVCGVHGACGVACGSGGGAAGGESTQRVKSQKINRLYLYIIYIYTGISTMYDVHVYT